MDLCRFLPLVLLAIVEVKSTSILEIISTDEGKTRRPEEAKEDFGDLESARVSLKNLLRGSENALVVTKKSHIRKDWCKATPFLQEINEKGCLQKTILNKFCYGQCNSFFIPNGATERRRKGVEPAFKSCPGCMPRRWSWVTVILSCPSEQPPTKRMKVFRVRQCQCVPMEI